MKTAHEIIAAIRTEVERRRAENVSCFAKSRLAEDDALLSLIDTIEAAVKDQVSLQTETEKQYVRTLKALISDFIRDRNPEDVPYYQSIFDWLEGRHIEQEQSGWLGRE